MSIDVNALVNAAQLAMGRAYCPHSKFQVGAALLTEDGHIITAGTSHNFRSHFYLEKKTR